MELADIPARTAMPQIREGFASQRLVRRSEEWLGRALSGPVSRDYCITDIGHFPETRFHYVDRKAGLSEHILIYNRTGAGRAVLGGRSWTVPPEHVLLIPRAVPHIYGADESAPWSIYWLHFAGERADQLLELLGTSQEKPLLSVKSIEGLLPLFESVLEIAMKSVNPDDAPTLSERLLHLINVLKRASSERHYPEPRVDSRVEKALNFMRANLNRSCSIAEIARAAGLSVPQLSSLFRSHLGTSPLRFFTRWRMQRAARMLEQTTDPINAVAERIGYEDSFYFCRVFRHYVGLSPRHYRQRLKETPEA
jgi:AraC family transcriptional regulator, arabinose operon regulatory protein